MFNNEALMKLHITDVVLGIALLIIVGILIAKTFISDELSNDTLAKRTLRFLWIIAIIYFLVVISILLFKKPIFQIEQTLYPLFAAIGIILSAFIASMSVIVSVQNTNSLEAQKKQYETSEFYLEKALEELSNVYDLLTNAKNDRVQWVLTARVLNLAIELSENITEENHKKVYSLQEFQLKHKLRKLLELDEENGLPLSYFVGLKNWKTATDVDAESEFNKIIIQNQLSLRSVIPIYDFVGFSDEYIDPLDNVKIPTTKDELRTWEKSGGILNIKSGVKKYIKLKQDIS